MQGCWKASTPPQKKHASSASPSGSSSSSSLNLAFSWRWKHFQLLQSNPLRLEKIDFKVANQITKRIQIRPWWFLNDQHCKKQQQLKQLNLPEISPLLSSVCSQHFKWCENFKVHICIRWKRLVSTMQVSCLFWSFYHHLRLQTSRSRAGLTAGQEIMNDGHATPQRGIRYWGVRIMS